MKGGDENLPNETEKWQLLHPKHKFPLYNTKLPLVIINVLAQPRKTFKEIDILGDDIAEKNQYELLLIARFDAKHCQEYIKEINDLWETNYHIENLVYVIEQNIKIFYVLGDGERRYRELYISERYRLRILS